MTENETVMGCALERLKVHEKKLEWDIGAATEVIKALGENTEEKNK